MGEEENKNTIRAARISEREKKVNVEDHSVISYHHHGPLIEAAAQESTIAGLVNADQTNPVIQKVPLLRLEACIAGASDPWGTCSVPHHTACQTCRGIAYSASGQS